MNGSTNNGLETYDAMVYTIRAYHPAIEMPTHKGEVEGYFLSCFHKKRSILLLDDASSKTQVINLLPKSPCLVIVTSRRNLGIELDVANVVTKRLGELSIADATSMLRSLLDPSRLTGQQAERIARLCGRWPLALRVVGGMLARHSNLNPETIIKKLKSDEREILMLENETLYTSLRASFDLLSERLQGFFLSLSLYEGTFDDEAVAAVFEEEESKVQEWLGELIVDCLVEYNSVTCRYHLHDTIRSFTTVISGKHPNEMKKWKFNFATYYCKILRTARDLYLKGADELLSGLRLFDQNRANIEHVMRMILKDPTELPELFCTFARLGHHVFAARLNPRDFIEMYESACAQSVDDGKSMSVVDRAFLLNELGYAYLVQGKYDDAQKSHQLALTLIEGTAHKDDKGRTEEAEDEEKVTYAMTLKYLGQLYFEQCKFSDAVTHLAKSLQVWMQWEQSCNNKKPLSSNSEDGEEQGRILEMGLTLMSLGECHTQLGNHHEAELVLQRALTLFGCNISTSSSSTNSNNNNNNPQSTSPQFEKTANSEITDPTNMQVGRCLDLLGRLHSIRGNFSEAKRVYMSSLSFKYKILGDHNLEVARTRHYLAELLGQEGSYTEALLQFTESMKAREACLGSEHPLVANSLRHIAFLTFYMGEPKEAEKIFLKVRVMLEAVLGTDHLEVAIVLNDLGLVYSHERRYEESEPLLRQSLAIRKRLLGAQHPFIAVTLNNLGNFYRKKHEFVKAQKKFEKALKIREACFGRRHVEVARTMHNIAALYCDLHKYEEAKKMFEEALEIRKSVLGQSHAEVASTYNGLGTLCEHQKNWQEALKWFRLSLGINTTAFGECHPSVGSNLYKIGNCLRLTKQYEEAEQIIKLSVANCEQRVKNSTEEERKRRLVLSLNILQKLYRDWGEGYISKLNETLRVKEEVNEEVMKKIESKFGRCIKALKRLKAFEGDLVEAMKVGDVGESITEVEKRLETVKAHAKSRATKKEEKERGEEEERERKKKEEDEEAEKKRKEKSEEEEAEKKKKEKEDEEQKQNKETLQRKKEEEERAMVKLKEKDMYGRNVVVTLGLLLLLCLVTLIVKW